jgi:uncharacterized membrane protein
MYTIAIDSDGSATWIIERKTLLENENDTSNFSSTFFHSSVNTLQEFSDNVTALVNRIWLQVKREEMYVKDFKLTASISQTSSVTYGIVKYKFSWIGFAEKANKTEIVIGDVFLKETFMFGNGMLIITYPEQYIVTASPTPDEKTGQTLKWYNTANFEERHPKITLKEKSVGLWSFLQDNMLFLVIAIITGIGSTSLIIFKSRKRQEKTKIETSVEMLPHEMEDEEKIVSLLKASGGTLYQSAITKKLGFSKAKTSQILSSMEKRGIIKRKKHGREKLVTFIPPKERERLKR